MICLADLFSALIHVFFLKMNLSFSFNEDLIVNVILKKEQSWWLGELVNFQTHWWNRQKSVGSQDRDGVSIKSNLYLNLKIKVWTGAM